MVTRISSSVRRGATSPAFWLLTICASTVCLTNLSSSMTWSGESGLPTTTKTIAPSLRKNLAEGTTLPDTLGVIRYSDQRIKFIELRGEHREFICLENVALERVQQAAQEESSDCAWIITGQVTEYRGTNFLIIDSATPAPKRNIASM